jgi:hypothetical protein
MGDQPPKTGSARRLWELGEDDVDEIFAKAADDREREKEAGR